MTNFKTNVRFGVNHLIGKYNLNSRDYVCTSESYSGWQRALRGYNGWSLTDGSPDCYKEDGTRKGNWYYVSDITRIKDRDDFIELFPECEDSSVSPGQVSEIR